MHSEGLCNRKGVIDKNLKCKENIMSEVSDKVI